MEVQIEINNNITVVLSDWVYDAIINRTIAELKDEQPDLKVYLEQSKRWQDELLSFANFDSEEYKIVAGYFRNAYYSSKEHYSGIFKKKNYKKFLKEYSDLIYMLSRDVRYYD